MGANLQTFTTVETDRDKIRKVWAAGVELSREQDGTSYSGCIGMFGGQRIQFKTGFEALPNWDIADEWLADHHVKYDPPIAIRFLDNDKVTKWMIGGWVAE